MIDTDSAPVQPLCHDEVVMDGDVKALAPLLTLYDGVVALLQEEERQEGSVVMTSVERPQLILYVRKGCPYCEKVTKYLKEKGKTIPMKDIAKDKQVETELVQVGGKKQVPCLVINGKALYESSDIIRWLKDHKDQF